MGNDSSIKNILQNSLDQIRTIVDANTVLGNPVTTPSGTTIIPISKLSIGFASGGLELPPRAAAESNQNFGGGGGTGVTLIPLGILAIYADGKVDMIPMAAPGEKISNPIGQIAELLDNAPSIIARIKDAISGVVPQKEEESETSEEEIKQMEDAVSEQLNFADAIPLTEKERKKIVKIEEQAAKRAGKL